jgi:ribose transport system ATP-binding protein
VSRNDTDTHGGTATTVADAPPQVASAAPADVLAIDAQNVEKVYGATVALADATLAARPGEIHALLGENGAGKSTLVRILAGVERHDGGDVQLFGEPVKHADPTCAFIHQDLSLYPTMSVAENIGLGGGYQRRLGLISERATIRATDELLGRLGIRLDARTMVGELPLADQTAVAVARALSHGVRMIVLDEPTAYLEAHQVRGLLDLLQQLRTEGVACLLITHRASDVLEVCDSLTVLRDGRTVATGACEGLSERQLVKLISGESAVSSTKVRPVTSTSRALSLRGVEGDGFGPLDIDVGVGEIVGLCGLADAGAFEVGKAIFGLEPLTGGEIELDGERHVPRTPAHAIESGIGYVPPERRAEGIADTLTARENLFMRPLMPWYRRVGGAAERRRTAELMELFDVRPNDPEREIGTFSGGNQQKIVLAKWLAKSPKVLILNEPTAGVDLAAKADIHARLRSASETHGFGVLLISTDFTEVAESSHRVYVMHRKQIVDEVDAEQASPERLVELAYGETA